MHAREHFVVNVSVAGGLGAPSPHDYPPTILRHDGPNHLGLRYDVLAAHQMALITSGCARPSVLLRSFGAGKYSVDEYMKKRD